MITLEKLVTSASPADTNGNGHFNPATANLLPSPNPNYLYDTDENGLKTYYDLDGNEYAGDIDDPTDPDMKLQYDMSGWKRGAVIPLPAHQTEMRLRVDKEIVDWFINQVREDKRRGRGSYTRLMNEALREHIRRASDETVEPASS